MAHSKNHDDGPLTTFSTLVGEFIKYWGFKKIHGQLWTLIYLHPQRMSATTLSQKLKVSKASVSLALKDLVQFNVVRESARHGKRTIYFESNPDLLDVITTILRNRECILLSKIFNEFSTLDPAQCHNANFSSLGDMIRTARDFLNLLVESKLEINKLLKLDHGIHSLISEFL